MTRLRLYDAGPEEPSDALRPQDPELALPNVRPFLRVILPDDVLAAPPEAPLRDIPYDAYADCWDERVELYIFPPGHLPQGKMSPTRFAEWLREAPPSDVRMLREWMQSAG
jgi:hypothetical protein